MRHPPLPPAAWLAVLLAGDEPHPAPDGPPPGAYGCLLLTWGAGGLPSYVPSALGTITLDAGGTYVAAAFPGGGTYTVDAARGRVTFRGGTLGGVVAAFGRLGDGTPILRFGENLTEPAPEVTSGRSIGQGDG